MNVYVGNRLPSAYQEVEYIQSSGTQYIDTGFKPSNKTKVINKGYILDAYMYGVGLAGSYYSLALYNGDGTHYRGRCRSSSSGNSTVNSPVACNTTSHIFECSQIDGLYIDGTQIGTFTQYTYTESYNMYLFAWNNYRDNIADGKSNGRMYYCKIYENGTLVRDFVPCYRISDNEIGLYDLVNNQFYTNSGTGTFSKGSDVTMTMLKNAYIGEVYEYSYDFRNKSTTILTNDGYSFQQGTSQYVFDSGGMSTNTSSFSQVRKSFPSLAGFTKIRVSGTIVVSSTSSSSLGQINLRTATSGGIYNGVGPYVNSSNLYVHLCASSSQTPTKQIASGISTGTYNYDVLYNFSTGNISYTIGSYTGTANIATNDISLLNELRINLQSGCKIQTVNFIAS